LKDNYIFLITFTFIYTKSNTILDIRFPGKECLWNAVFHEELWVLIPSDIKAHSTSVSRELTTQRQSSVWSYDHSCSFFLHKNINNKHLMVLQAIRTFPTCINLNSFSSQRNVWFLTFYFKDNCVPNEQKEAQGSFMFKLFTLPTAKINTPSMTKKPPKNSKSVTLTFIQNDWHDFLHIVSVS